MLTFSSPLWNCLLQVAIAVMSILTTLRLHYTQSPTHSEFHTQNSVKSTAPHPTNFYSAVKLGGFFASSTELGLLRSVIIFPLTALRFLAGGPSPRNQENTGSHFLSQKNLFRFTSETGGLNPNCLYLPVCWEVIVWQEGWVFSGVTLVG